MFFHCASLTVLHLQKLPELNDSEIAEILQECPQILDLSLVEMNTGVLSIEAIASVFPGIEKIRISGSRLLTDSALRCLSSVCLSLKEMTLHDCPSLTDDGFARATMLKYLHKLDLGYCSAHLTGGLLSQFSLCPLSTLIMDGVSAFEAAVVDGMSLNNKKSMRLFSCKNSNALTTECVSVILDRLIFARSFDFTGCSVESELATLQHANPFVSYFYDPGFCGYKLTAEKERQILGYQQLQKHFVRHRVARMIQKYVRLILRRRRSTEVENNTRRKKKIIKAAARLCAFARGCKSRKVTNYLLWAGRTITRLGRRHVRSMWYLKSVNARKHFELMYKGAVFKAWHHFASDSKALLMKRAERLYPRLALRLKRTTLENMRAREVEILFCYLQPLPPFKFPFCSRFISIYMILNTQWQI